jgi:hypothetical protein
MFRTSALHHVAKNVFFNVLKGIQKTALRAAREQYLSVHFIGNIRITPNDKNTLHKIFVWQLFFFFKSFQPLAPVLFS